MRWASCVVGVGFVLGVASGAGAQSVEGEEANSGLDSDSDSDSGVSLGRGFYYGAHVISPIHLSSIERAATPVEALDPTWGAGVHVRFGWELPAGFSVELYGGLAFNEMPTVAGEPDDRSHVMIQGVVALAGRYAFVFDPVFRPFVQLAIGSRFFFATWGSGIKSSPEVGGLASGALGVDFELEPYFQLEVGAMVDYTFGAPGLVEGFVTVTPFAGVTLFLYDEHE